jgi:hypothetical protein
MAYEFVAGLILNPNKSFLSHDTLLFLLLVPSLIDLHG